MPHFLDSPCYVYAYSFGELLVMALFNIYQKRGKEFVPDYLDVLAAGDSDYPDRILAKAGINLSDPAFWDEGLDALAKTGRSGRSAGTPGLPGEVREVKLPD